MYLFLDNGTTGEFGSQISVLIGILRFLFYSWIILCNYFKVFFHLFIRHLRARKYRVDIQMFYIKKLKRFFFSHKLTLFILFDIILCIEQVLYKPIDY